MGTGEAGVYYTSGGSNRVHHQALIHSIDAVSYTHLTLPTTWNV